MSTTLLDLQLMTEFPEKILERFNLVIQNFKDIDKGVNLLMNRPDLLHPGETREDVRQCFLDVVSLPITFILSASKFQIPTPEESAGSSSSTLKDVPDFKDQKIEMRALAVAATKTELKAFGESPAIRVSTEEQTEQKAKAELASKEANQMLADLAIPQYSLHKEGATKSAKRELSSSSEKETIENKSKRERVE